ncbi:protein translocase subunit SecD [Limobrevibacterium gyesilva]|uniref:Protein translocase subunit SecD n=1 Tax=Limobrevibacterium gyesilva TaxID=2991712 RepID=A0AA41YJ41_9PROT|nr:protein translocase subunit SecD [Limobrevibacterium gyesilva]MCW3474099.1 protein translocase subunit SecD [Limobrevibacterium gyesilva]
MMYFSRLKTAMVVGICVLGVLLSLPNLFPSPASWVPWRTIHLGLDLRGGSYLLLEVDMNAVVKERLDSLADSARQSLRRAGVPRFTATPQPAQNRIVVRIDDQTKQDAALAALRELATAAGGSLGARPDLDFEVTPGQITITLSPAALIDRATAAVQQSIEIVRRRIDETGVVDPMITRQGESRIVVQLPGVEDPNRIKEMLGKTARMTFRLTDENANLNAAVPPPGVDFLPLEGQAGGKIAVRRRVEVDGANLTDARAGQNPQTGEWVVNFTFDSVGTRRFADISRANVGHPFAIVLDDKVISAPVIREPITGGRGQISGRFDARTATDLSVLLRAGALPAPLTVVEERSVGPELGADAIRAGAIALAVGFVLVMVYMAFFYGLFGWMANVALLVNLVLLTAVLSLLEATLTLPGMAGILLTLGMAVDANILINERIREEVRNGRTPLNAMETGIRRAFSTIIDSNATGFLAHVMLFVFGTGPVRGFAVTITVGIATSLFTATMLVRLLMVRWYAARRPAVLPV